MTGMFDIDWRTSYPLSKIARITRVEKAKTDVSYRLLMKDDEYGTEITPFTHSRIMAHPVQLLPAQPGIMALTACIEDGDAEVLKTPVIAWALCFDGSIRAVTPMGVDDGHMWRHGCGYVEMPSGGVHAVGDLDYLGFDSVDAYLKHEIDQRNQLTEHAESAEALA